VERVADRQRHGYDSPRAGAGNYALDCRSFTGDDGLAWSIQCSYDHRFSCE
jgi:hypothetical protein